MSKAAKILNLHAFGFLAWSFFMMGMDPPEPCYDRFHHVAMTVLGLVAIALISSGCCLLVIHLSERKRGDNGNS